MLRGTSRKKRKKDGRSSTRVNSRPRPPALSPPSPPNSSATVVQWITERLDNQGDLGDRSSRNSKGTRFPRHRVGTTGTFREGKECRTCTILLILKPFQSVPPGARPHHCPVGLPIGTYELGKLSARSPYVFTMPVTAAAGAARMTE